MRKQRVFRPTGDGLEKRDVPATMAAPLRIAPVAHATIAGRVNTPFANTAHLLGTTAGRQLNASRTTTNTGRSGLNNAALNQLAVNLATSQLATNLGLTNTQLRSLIARGGAGSPLATSLSSAANAIRTNLTNANLTNANLASLLAGATANATSLALANALRNNLTNPNLSSILGTGTTTSLLNNGVNFPATLSTGSNGTSLAVGSNTNLGLAGLGFGNSFGLGNTLGFGNSFGLGNTLGFGNSFGLGSTLGFNGLSSPFGTTSFLTGGTGPFVSFM